MIVHLKQSAMMGKKSTSGTGLLGSRSSWCLRRRCCRWLMQQDHRSLLSIPQAAVNRIIAVFVVLSLLFLVAWMQAIVQGSMYLPYRCDNEITDGSTADADGESNHGNGLMKLRTPVGTDDGGPDDRPPARDEQADTTSSTNSQQQEIAEDNAQGGQAHILWSWECKYQQDFSTPGHYCVRDHTNHPSEAISFQECSLTCGNNRSLWPLPRKINRLGSGVVEFEPTKIKLDLSSIHSAFAGNHPTSSSHQSASVSVKKAGRDFLESAWKLFINDIRQYGGQSSKKLSEEQTSPHDKYAVTVHVSLGSHDLKQTIGATKESYTLRVQAKASDQTSRIYIFGDTVYGVRHGLETLSQLMDFDPYRKCWILLDEADLEDRPAYPYRGLLIDVTRTFIPMDILKTMVDAMGWNKMNVLHLHLTDSQNFPFKSNRVPELQHFAMYNTLLSQGIYGDGSPENHYYSTKALQDLVSHARLRGVKVLPEIDGPAHVNSGWEWAPVLTVCTDDDFKGLSKWKKFCQEPPCGQFDPNHKALYTMLKRLYEDLFEIFDTDLFHMGGDEVNINCWNQSATIVSYINSSRPDKTAPLRVLDFVYYWSEVYQKKTLGKLDYVIHQDKREKTATDVILWTSKLTDPEIVSRFLSSERYIIQIWDEVVRGTAFKLMEKGYRVIASNYDALYLDCGQADWTNKGQNWCSPQAGWHDLYDFVMPDASYLKQRDPDQEVKGELLGAEACMWTEQTSHHTLEGKTWPRLSGLAERMWTNPSSGSVSAWDRINLQAHRMLQRGIRADQLQPMWCLLNPGICFRTPGKG